jgi:hypothetical protein
LDLLYPVVEGLRANNFVDAAIELIGSLRAELQYYAEAPPMAPEDYAMPEEARKLETFGFWGGFQQSEYKASIVEFLASPTEYELSSSITKPVREYLHHLLDNCCVGLASVFPLGKEYKSCVILRKGRFTSPDDIAKANIIRQRCKDLLDMNSHYAMPMRCPKKQESALSEQWDQQWTFC